jgi:hypothetical protein
VITKVSNHSKNIQNYEKITKVKGRDSLALIPEYKNEIILPVFLDHKFGNAG